MSASLVLALDTATRCSTIALTRGGIAEGEVLAQQSFCVSMNHSRKILKRVHFLLEEAGFRWSDVGLVAVGLGPGSFTGLRIGMATAKGISFAASLPLAGVSTLDALAATCCHAGQVCVVLDARKKEVYCAFYDLFPGERPKRCGPIRAMDPNELAGILPEDSLLVGDGACTYKTLWQNCLGGRVRFAPAPLNMPSAAAIGLLCSGERWENLLDPASASPLYVRASDAELNLGKATIATSYGKND